MYAIKRTIADGLLVDSSFRRHILKANDSEKKENGGMAKV